MLALADWLRERRIRTVALESTGVYWIPVFEILEARGFEVILTNARDARNVPGRKSEVNDAQWLQKMHEFGLLRANFQPNQEVAVLRTYLRQRERLLDYCSAHIQHMQKALMQMNVQHCDQRSEAALASLEVPEQVPQVPLPKARHRTKAPNAPAFDVRE